MSNLKRERHIMLRRDMLAAMREEQRLADLAGVQLTVTPIWWWVKRAVLRREAREARIRTEVWRLALEGGKDMAKGGQTPPDGSGTAGTGTGEGQP
jgi:hypothetical protein